MTVAILFAMLFLMLWLRELSKRVSLLEQNTLKALDVIADRLEDERNRFDSSIDYVLSTDAFRSMKLAVEQEDWVRAAIVRLRHEGKFEAAWKLEEMEHQIRRGVDSRVFKNLFRGIGWIPE